jgi:hypothetical protein
MWSGVRHADIGEKVKADASVCASSGVVARPLKWSACSLAIVTGMTSLPTISPHQSNPSGPLTLSLEGWHRVGEPGLTVAFALPDGWVRQPAGELQSTWRSPTARMI